MKIKISLEAQITLFISVLLCIMLATVSLFFYWFDSFLLAIFVSAAIIFPLSVIAIHLYMNPINRILSALNNGFHNFLDNDFSVSLAQTRDDEFGGLVKVYNKVGAVLRDERLNLYQRELLLDTVIQTTSLALVLTEDSGVIIYSNSAAKQLINKGEVVNGLNFINLLKNKPKPFLQSVESGLSGLFTVTQEDGSEAYYLTQNQFLLNGQNHHLYLFKSLTKEISRQEVNTWKKVIRLISHELNNSLAPISSLAHSGELLSKRQDADNLATIFSAMGERAGYLQTFIEGYATFARLPNPQCQMVNSFNFLTNLRSIQNFELECKEDEQPIYCDPAQLQQVIINLVKNAHEASVGFHVDGSEPKVFLSLQVFLDSFEIQIKDRGKGMSATNLANSLLPFYSTKAEGTGLGLPLCREIIEAHGGKMSITLRRSGGVKVSVILPTKKL